MFNDFTVIGAFLLGGTIFAIFGIFINWLVRPKKPHAEKEETYECGLDTQGPAWVQFKVNYFMYALIFVVFDVETVFLYPWAVKFNSLGSFALIEMIIFIGILILGLWYALKKGALEWE